MAPRTAGPRDSQPYRVEPAPLPKRSRTCTVTRLRNLEAPKHAASLASTAALCRDGFDSHVATIEAAGTSEPVLLLGQARDCAASDGISRETSGGEGEERKFELPALKVLRGIQPKIDERDLTISELIGIGGFAKVGWPREGAARVWCVEMQPRREACALRGRGVSVMVPAARA